MVRKIYKDGKTIYTCELCGFGYLDEDTAKKCEDYCSRNFSCSLEITSKAVYIPESL
ncbi:MAG: hypothetical protein QW486_07830 [Candidatus Bathyarchaeia archaeon]